jgi:hypothetical protein
LLTVLLVAAVVIPLFHREPDEMAQQQPTAPRGEPSITTERPAIPRAFASAAPADAEVSLSAWQEPAKPSGDLETVLARFEQTDPALRSLAVARLSRAILE